MGVFESIFGSANKKELKKIEPIIKKMLQSFGYETISCAINRWCCFAPR